MNDMTNGATARFDQALRERIEDLLCDYAHALDDGQIDRWPGFFTETCVYHVTTREGHEAGLPIGIMRCVGRGMMLDRVKAFHTANIFEPHNYNHVLGRASMALGPAPDTFACRSNFHVFRIMQDCRTDLFAKPDDIWTPSSLLEAPRSSSSGSSCLIPGRSTFCWCCLCRTRADE